MNLRFFGENHKNLLTFTKTVPKKWHKKGPPEIFTISQGSFVIYSE